MATYSEVIKERTNKILPKVFKEAEDRLGYQLPNAMITNVNTYATGKIINDEYVLVLGGVFVDAIISKKDGSFGKVKKLVYSTIENILNVSGFKYEEIYVTYSRGEKSDFINENVGDKSTEKFINLLKNTLSGEREFKGDYAMPYSSSDEDRVDFVIEYKINKITMWKVNSNHCNYEGVIYVKIDRVLVGFEHLDEWESAHIHDLPSWAEDNFKDSIYDDIEIFGKLCLDVDYEK